jgi:hypothetical protein
MTLARWTVAAALTLAPATALAQDKPTVSGYLNQDYKIVNVESGGGQFIFFILQKDKTAVWCSVLVQSGETSSCRTIK